MIDRYCPAGKINCQHSYINDSDDKYCNPNNDLPPTGIGVVVGPISLFPADEVCRWPSKQSPLKSQEKICPACGSDNIKRCPDKPKFSKCGKCGNMLITL